LQFRVPTNKNCRVQSEKDALKRGKSKSRTFAVCCFCYFSK